MTISVDDILKEPHVLKHLRSTYVFVVKHQEVKDPENPDLLHVNDTSLCVKVGTIKTKNISKSEQQQLKLIFQPKDNPKLQSFITFADTGAYDQMAFCEFSRTPLWIATNTDKDMTVLILFGKHYTRDKTQDEKLRFAAFQEFKKKLVDRLRATDSLNSTSEDDKITILGDDHPMPFSQALCLMAVLPTPNSAQLSMTDIARLTVKVSNELQQFLAQKRTEKLARLEKEQVPSDNEVMVGD